MAFNTVTDRSGTVTAGGTSQQIMAAAAEYDDRQYLLIQNISTGDLWVRAGAAAAAAQPSLRLIPGSSLEWSYSGNGYCPSQTINVFGSTTGQAFVAMEGP